MAFRVEYYVRVESLKQVAADVVLRVGGVRTGHANGAVIAVDIGVIRILSGRTFSEDAIQARVATWADVLVVVTLRRVVACCHRGGSDPIIASEVSWAVNAGAR